MISIIIPTLNEEDHIGKVLEHLTINATDQNISEIIVVDGGSVDNTRNIVSGFSEFSSKKSEGVKAFNYVKKECLQAKTPLRAATTIKINLIPSEKGRAKQMNIGAQAAKGNILYFLHADSFPPKDFDQLIINEVRKNNKAGCFRMQFDSTHLWLRLASWFTQFNWRACRGGDQSQFITKALFNKIGGYDESYIIYEDNILINKLYARNQFVVINRKLKSSARMYRKHGVWKLQYFFCAIYIKKWFGASPNELYAYYKRHIS